MRAGGGPVAEVSGRQHDDLVASLKAKLKEAKGAQAKTLKADLAAAQKEYGKPIAEYTGALKKLLPMQRSDFAHHFKESFTEHDEAGRCRRVDAPPQSNQG